MIAVLAAATILVVPFEPKGDAPPASGVALAESILDVVVQGKIDNFLTLKQLDAVLRRRDLRLTDADIPRNAVELARTLGASDVITGEVWLNGGKWLIDARRLKVADGSVAGSTKVEGARAALAGLAQKAGTDLLGGVVPQGLITGSAAALEAGARRGAALARPSLGAQSKITPGARQLPPAEKTRPETLPAVPQYRLP